MNGHFGAVFKSLLPGVSAKLAPPEGGTVLDGLEVKVAFNGVWKETLTDLSGGQRSLLALSLILAMLLFKPAPMYILDEIDAALDLSHTQNIGNMIRTHFAKSQFIVVSLKQGLFNNANVIFRTKFVEVRACVGGRGARRRRRRRLQSPPSRPRTSTLHRAAGHRLHGHAHRARRLHAPRRRAARAAARQGGRRQAQGRRGRGRRGGVSGRLATCSASCPLRSRTRAHTTCCCTFPSA